MSRKDKAVEEFSRSSGNIFADLGIDDADVQKVKAALALKLNELIDHERCSQTELATRLGLQQPHISQLRHYKLKGFSVERLMELIVKLGVPVEIRFGARKSTGAKLQVVKGPLLPFIIITHDASQQQRPVWRLVGETARASSQGSVYRQHDFASMEGDVFHKIEPITSSRVHWKSLQ